MPNENENKFKELLGDLNFFNKLSSKGKGLFQNRGKSISHPSDCSCDECKRESLNLYLFGKGDFRG